MLAKVLSHAPLGIDGEIINVEVDLRTGIPGIDVVGLPDVAVREAKERVRVAIHNSGFRFPARRILINLSPAGLRKAGAGYDLPMAIAILAASEQLPLAGIHSLMIMGELNLSGEVKPVHGILSAIGAGIKQAIRTFLVPQANLQEACVLNTGQIFGISSLKEAITILHDLATGNCPASSTRQEVAPAGVAQAEASGDMADLKGHWLLKRSLEVAAAGKHHIFLFGAPGSGKTMAATRMPGILPELSHEESLLVTKIHSLAGILPMHTGLITRPPFRMPHHSATREGVIGGGKNPGPGEVSLAHHGILFLDETPEFKKSLLQALREPIEAGRVTIARAESHIWYPAAFQLIMAANACPCGNLGREEHVCLCSTNEIAGYWKRIGGALLDRIDIRVPVKPVAPEKMMAKPETASHVIRGKVEQAVLRQRARYRGLSFSRNAEIPPGLVDKYCKLDRTCTLALSKAVEKLAISSRAFHSIIKLSRTIADLAASENIQKDHLLEAIQHRRYGDGDYFWSFQ